MTSYALDIVIDGKVVRQTMSAIPGSVVARFYSIEQEETVTLLAEKVLK